MQLLRGCNCFHKQIVRSRKLISTIYIVQSLTWFSVLIICFCRTYKKRTGLQKASTSVLALSLYWRTQQLKMGLLYDDNFFHLFFGNYEKNQAWNESQSSSIMFVMLSKISFGYCCAYVYFFSELLAQRLHFLLQLMKWSD